MQIDFTLDNEPLSKLIQNYVAQSKKASGENVLMNSILVQLMALNNPLETLLKECQLFLQLNLQQKQLYAKIMQLLNQVCIRAPKTLRNSSQQSLATILELCTSNIFVTVCANDAIELLTSIVTLCPLSQSTKSVFIAQQVLKILMNPKMMVSAYRQKTRLALYRLLLFTLNCTQSQETLLDRCKLKRYDLIDLIIRSIENEKDPRNILLAFQLYRFMLDNFSEEQLALNQKTIYESLEAYYPIDFVGDDDPSHKNVSIKQIKHALNECLCHPLFTKQTSAMLMDKLREPPIGRFIDTFNLFLKREVKGFQCDKLLIKMTQDQYFEESEEDCNLGTLYISLMKKMFPSNNCYPLKSYESMLLWVDKLICKKIYNNPQNNQQAGTIINILKTVVHAKLSQAATKLLTEYLVVKFMELYLAPGDITFKLGVILVLLNVRTLSSETTAALLMTLGKIFHEGEEPVRMMVLKILMQLYNKGDIKVKKMIKNLSDGTLFKHSLHMVSNSQNSEQNAKQIGLQVSLSAIQKSYIDYYLCVYDEQQHNKQLMETIDNIQLKIYASVSIVLQIHQKSEPQVRKSAIELVQQQFLPQIKTILSFLSKIKLQFILNLIQTINLDKLDNPASSDSMEVIIKLRSLLISKFDGESQYDFILRLIHSCAPLWKVYLFRSELKALILSQSLQEKQRLAIRDYLVQNKEEKSSSIEFSLYQRLVTFMKHSIIIKGQMEEWEINSTETSEQEEKMLIPSGNSKSKFQRDHLHKYEPTMIHYFWVHRNPESEEETISILEYLPECLLAEEAKKLLPLLTKNQQLLPLLAKIIPNISKQILKEQVVPFCCGFLATISENPQNPLGTVENLCSCFEIMIHIIKNADQRVVGKQVNEPFSIEQIQLLNKALKSLIKHQKRKVRQNTRVFMSLIDSYYT